MKTLGRLAATLGLVAALSACVAPAAGGLEVSPGNDGRPSAANEAVTTNTVVTVSGTKEGLDVALTQLAKATHAECFTAAHDSIMAPSSAELADADRVGNAGVDAKGRVVGDEAAIVAAYEAGTVVARTPDGLQSFILATVSGRQAAVAVRGYRTPAGNTLWVQVSQSVATGCS